MTAMPFAGFNSDRIDDMLVNPTAYADETIHDAYTTLRRDDPVHWTQPNGFRPFWSITRHADIVAISKANDRFINRERTYISPIEAEDWVKATTGDSHLFRTLVDLDDPLHMKLRRITNTWFMHRTCARWNRASPASPRRMSIAWRRWAAPAIS